MPIIVHAKPHPLRTDFVRSEHENGLSIRQLVEAVQPDPLLRESVHVGIRDATVPPEWWDRVKPKSGTVVIITVLPETANAGLTGAGSALTMAGTIAMFIPGGQPYGLALMGMGLALTLTAQFAFPPPTDEVAKPDDEQSRYSLTSSRNRLTPQQLIPTLCGEMRFTPIKGAEDAADVVGPNMYLRTILELSTGLVTNPQLYIGSTEIENYAEVETEFRRGWHTSQINDLGSWDASSGAYPASPSFGDHYTVSVAGTVGDHDYAVDDTITFNGLAAADTVAAWDLNQFKQFKVYPGDTFRESFSDELTSAGGPLVRTTPVNTYRSMVMILFPEGIYHVENDPPGRLAYMTVSIRVEYSPHGADTWTEVKNYSGRFRTRQPKWWGLPVDLPSAGQWDLRVTRTFGDGDARNVAKSYLQWIQSDQDAVAIEMNGAARVGLRIRASGQLQGSIDQVQAQCQSIAPHWNGSAWNWQPTSQPAAMMRRVLQIPTREDRPTNAELDLDRLQEWADYTNVEGLTCNGIIEGERSLYEALQDICRCGFASLHEGVRSVIIDNEKPVPIQVITPRNSLGYKGEIKKPPKLHGLHVGFWDREAENEFAERLVLDDGYTEETATRTERLPLWGVDSGSLAFRHGRRWIAFRRLRPESHTVSMDLEWIVAQRGHRVLLTHDAISIGVTSGRVLSRVDDGEFVSAIVGDAAANLPASNQYTLRARTASTVKFYDVQANDAESATYTFVDPPTVADAPPVEAIYTVGVKGLDVRDCIVADIKPSDDRTAEVRMIDYAPEIQTAHKAPIPAWESGAQPDRWRLPAPVINGDIQSSAEYMAVTPSGLVSQVVIPLTPSPIVGVQLFVAYEAVEDPGWKKATLISFEPTRAVVQGPEEGAIYNFSLVYTRDGYFQSAPARKNGHFVIGRTAAPVGLSNFVVSVVGEAVLARWDRPDELDVQYGGTIRFRYTLSPDGVYSESNPITTGKVSAGELMAWLPLITGRVFAQVVDQTGREGPVVSDVIDGEARVTELLPWGDGQYFESPTFPGEKDNFQPGPNGLEMVVASGWDAVPDVDALPDWDAGGTDQLAVATAAYTFAGTLNFGRTRAVRITRILQSISYGVSDFIDSRGEIDSWPSLDGDVAESRVVDFWTEFRTSSDGVTWSAWRRFEVAYPTTYYLQLKVRGETFSQSYSGAITDLGVLVEEVGEAEDGEQTTAYLAIAPLDADKAEGTGETSTPFTFTVSRSGNLIEDVSAEWVAAGSGDNPASVNATGIVTFGEGEASKIITVSIAADSEIEDDETFTVTLSNPSFGAEITTATATATIRNDDFPLTPSEYSIVALSADKNEGDAGDTTFTFTITRTGDTTGSGAISFVVTSNDADGNDFNGWSVS